MEELPMSEISDLLWLKSQDLAAKSNELSGSWRMIKSAAIKSLESRGVEPSEAEGLLEKLAEKAYTNLDEVIPGEKRSRNYLKNELENRGIYK